MTVTEAEQRILAQARLRPTETIDLADTVGRVLRETVLADRDFPPFDRVAMDGIAIRYADFEKGTRVFWAAGTQRAGQPPLALTKPDTCLEVMTGAMLPTGADTVIRYEDLTLRNHHAIVSLNTAESGLNVHHQATDQRKDNDLLPIGTRLGPVALAVATSVGRHKLQVSTLPRIAIISTGDELVDVTETPLPWQIRRSNGPMLRALLHPLGLNAQLHHLPDDEAALFGGLNTLLNTHDILILSGGVSAGKADFMPDTLTRLGVQRQFHKIEQRPGRPLWFGTTTDGRTVFALPGNPVSSVVCAVRYVLPFLRASLGLLPEPLRFARLSEPVTFDPALTYFLPVALHTSPLNGEWLAQPLPGSGSADFTNLLAVDGFAELPAEETYFPAGTVVRIHSL